MNNLLPSSHRPAACLAAIQAAIQALIAGALLYGLFSTAPALAADRAPAVRPQVVVPDTIAQRLAACTSCHGKQGRATNDGYYPRIAGKPEGYLFNQLRNFRDGKRKYPLMTYMVGQMPDAYLQEMAEFFSSQHPPYPAPQAADADQAMLERGRQLVQNGDISKKLPACAACHGDKLTGIAPFIPGLLGLPRDYIVGQLGAWQTGARHAHAPDCMAQIAKGLSPQDIGAVSSWLASRPLPEDVIAPPAGAGANTYSARPLACGSAPQ
ncbi:c-type cytochrome [Undibacterium sp.]|uniref:c-type cytochrome n=1 Tax=Undibacterium sp. TaxID=1914977 RepID=UPI002D171137|nr:c-type cytochrome [Undibacterium sp.]HTD04206.1 c-type cytochrome [Undibacterium sp.]